MALSMWLSTHLFGANAFGIRVFSPLLALGTSLLMFSFARRLYGETVAIWTVLMLNFIPIFQAGALVMTIDPLSIFFWMAALYTFWLALEKSPAFTAWWPATGALIGLGFLAKYTNAMQLLSILLLLALTPKYRRELRRPGFYTLLAVFALFTAPVIIWNSQHAWITLLHLRDRGGLDSPARFNPVSFLTFLGLQFGVYGGLIYGAMLAAVAWSWKKARTHLKPRFLLAFTLPLLVMYFTLAFKKPGEPNWTAPAILSLSVLTVVYWLELMREKNWARTYAIAGLVLGGIVSVVAIDTDLLRRAGLPLATDPSSRARGWLTTVEKIEEIRNAYEAEHGEQVFLIANKYGTAASVGFYLPHRRPELDDFPPVFVPESAWPDNQFYFWPRYDGLVDYTDAAREKLRPASNLDPAVRAELAAALDAMPTATGAMPSEEIRLRFLHALKAAAPELGIDDYFTESFGYSPFVGRTALYITDRDDESRPPDVFARTFAHSEMIACFNILRRGTSLRQIRIFACTGYHLQEL
ncbi:MAG: glycosyltransferase family 39 protein [Chthoniobacter sp.]